MLTSTDIHEGISLYKKEVTFTSDGFYIFFNLNSEAEKNCQYGA